MRLAVACLCFGLAGTILSPLTIDEQTKLDAALDLSSADREGWRLAYPERMYSDKPFSKDSEVAMAAVKRHNFFRVDGAGLRPIKWNQTIADYAYDYLYRQEVLKHGDCQAEHNVGGKWGENIYHRCYYKYLPWQVENPGYFIEYYINDAVNSWFNEISRYQYKEGEQYNYCPQRGSQGTTLHFRQVMWDDTVHMGCAMKDCVVDAGYDNGEYDACVSVLCNYFEWGGAGYENRQPFGPESVTKLNNFPYVVNNIPGGLPECEDQTK